MPATSVFSSMASQINGDGYVPPSVSGADKKTSEQHFQPGKNPGDPQTIHNLPAVKGDEGDPYNEPMTIPPYHKVPATCADNCAEQERLAKVHCDIIRQRVAQWMKDTGCASSVRAFKINKPSCCGCSSGCSRCGCSRGTGLVAATSTTTDTAMPDA